MFLNSGDTICRIKYFNPIYNSDHAFIANSFNILKQKKIIVLTNSQTASGAEVVASALRTYAKARIIGRRTSGNGDIEIGHTNFSSNKFVCRIMAGEIYAANGSKISDGIEPDIIFDQPGSLVEFAVKLLTRK